MSVFANCDGCGRPFSCYYRGKLLLCDDCADDFDAMEVLEENENDLWWMKV